MNRYMERRLSALETDAPYLRHEDFVRLFGLGVDLTDDRTWPADLRGKCSAPRHLEALEALA